MLFQLWPAFRTWIVLELGEKKQGLNSRLKKNKNGNNLNEGLCPASELLLLLVLSPWLNDVCLMAWVCELSPADEWVLKQEDFFETEITMKGKKNRGAAETHNSYTMMSGDQSRFTGREILVTPSHSSGSQIRNSWCQNCS